MSFRDLVLKPALVTACESFGFESPSEIQSAAIPRAILKEDVIGQGKSGMGKTAVFVLAVLHQLAEIDADTKTQAVVLVHTPELAYQVGKEFERFAKLVSEDIVVATIVDQAREQVKVLKDKTPHIVVGLPGRISSMVTHKALDLSNVQHFVIDELDEMLQKVNMRADVQNVFFKTPKEKQVILMTATLSDEAKEVAKKFTQNPAEVYVSENKDLTLDGLLQYHSVMKEDEKLTKLLEFLDAHQFNQAVVFTHDEKPGRAQALASILDEQGFPAIALDGSGSVSSRLEKFKSFQSNEKPICVATDVAARGLDIQKCNIVVQYDMAKQADTYFHRIGRAGRFGTKGLCLSFVSHQKDVDTLKEVNSRFEAPMNKYTDPIDSNMYMSG